MSGKGSKGRPEDSKKIADNWDRIFNKGQKMTRSQAMAKLIESHPEAQALADAGHWGKVAALAEDAGLSDIAEAIWEGK